MLVVFAEIVRCQRGTAEHVVIDDRQLLADADIVPVAVVFAEVAKTLVRVKENVLVPGIRDSFDGGMAALKADDFIVRAAKLAPRAQRDERMDVAGEFFELLKDGQIGIPGVQDTTAASAHYRFGLSEAT